ncbi:MAG TPA: DUF3102 domain-containing protein [Microvirga sp.]|jgi:hypothetical protein|nr:DUF3102 domain-containing protein [Microvirga sp.]
MSHINHDETGGAEGGRSIAGGLRSYGGLTTKELETLRGCAERIRAAHRDVTERVFLIGRELAAAKVHLQHGHFRAWLQAEFGWSERTAQRYMQAVEVFGDKTDTVSVLEATAIYALSAKSTPDAVRTEIVARVEAGEKPSLREVQTKVADARKAERGRAILRANPDLTQPLLTFVRRPGGIAAQQAANFILEKLGEDRATLERLLKDADPKVLVEALRKCEVVDTAAPLRTIEI